LIVTGAASGIGRAVAKLFLARNRGAGRVLLVDRDRGGLQAVASEFGESASILPIDLGMVDAGSRVVTAALGDMGGIDGIASNAGVLLPGSLTTLSVRDFDQVFAVNTRATWLIAQAAFPIMRDGGGGSIVATASMAAWTPAPSLGAYAPSKAALAMVMRQLANEWGPYGIRCNTVSPGPTLSGMNKELFSDLTRREARASTIPTRRLGDSEDVAEAILFLLGPGAVQINGTDILVDGGLSTALMTTGLQVPNAPA